AQNRAEDTASTYQTGQQVAEVILEVVENENPPLRIRTSAWAEQFCELKTSSDPDGTKLRDRIQGLFFS
ncbi:MAG: short-chain dehydrogenase/reductase, partial [Bacteroidota bacterium]